MEQASQRKARGHSFEQWPLLPVTAPSPVVSSNDSDVERQLPHSLREAPEKHLEMVSEKERCSDRAAPPQDTAGVATSCECGGRGGGGAGVVHSLPSYTPAGGRVLAPPEQSCNTRAPARFSRRAPHTGGALPRLRPSTHAPATDSDGWPGGGTVPLVLCLHLMETRTLHVGGWAAALSSGSSVLLLQGETE